MRKLDYYLLLFIIYCTGMKEPGGQRGHGPFTFWQTMQKFPFQIRKFPFQIHNIITFTLTFYSSILPSKFSI